MNRWQRILMLAVVIVAGLYVVESAMPARQPSNGFHLDEFASLPVVYHGRVQPWDTVARNSLMIASGRQVFVEEKPEIVDGKPVIVNGEPVIESVRHPAVRWLLDVMVGTGELEASPKEMGPVSNAKVFRIENDQVLSLLGLKQRDGFRYSLAEIQPNIRPFLARFKKAVDQDPKTRDLVDNKVMELGQHIRLFQELVSQQTVYCIPPEAQGDKWNRIVDVQHQHDFAGTAYLVMLQAYAQDQPEHFNSVLTKYREWLTQNAPRDMWKAQFETFFNRLAPFYYAAILYGVMFVLACLSWLAWPRYFGRAAFALGVFIFLFHTSALIARMYIQGRPPVTNLYSSAVFIGWGCMALGLFLELVYRNGIGSAMGALTAGLSLIIAHILSQNGDTLEMLQAVLDTNFWLATHVTCITLGYTATFMAGFVGIFYILANLFVPDLRRETTQDITRMIYGILCFATLLSFTGTVLGGIWADQSWGRFWGWDPKENGALLIVLMNALTLHARWGGMVKARGLAVLAVLGNIVTAWSWFGVNMLGVGLHSYGFMQGAVFWLIAFVVSQLLLAGLGMLDPKHVRAFFAAAAEALGISPIAEDKVEVHS